MEVTYHAESNEVTTSSTEDSGKSTPNNNKNVRNLIGFWILGLCNNYSYVIMLSAAFDLLHPDHGDDSSNPNTNDTSNATESFCNPISTGAILLADILPSLAVKLTAPFFNISINFRVLVTIVLAAASFLITSFSYQNWLTFIGVVCAAISSGIGEITFLSFTSYFDKNVVSTWSSGTGGAGFIGALSYAALTHALSVRATLQLMLVFPVLMAVTYWLVIIHPPQTKFSCKCNCNSERDPMLRDSYDMSLKPTKTTQHYTVKQKLHLIKPLLKYMIPLCVVYFAEYFINQGLMELIYFPGFPLVHKEQYRWYQVDYQLGVLISRSSVNFCRVRQLWILPILQVINLVFLLCEAYFLFVPSIWIVFGLICYEGLLGGCAYVNAFYSISEEVPEEHREFSLGVASLADSFGIALSGITAIPVHSALCKRHT